MKKRQWIRGIVGIGVLTLITGGGVLNSEVWAGTTEEMVQASGTSAKPYMISIEVEGAKTENFSPGVYARHDKKWPLVIAGDVLVHQHEGAKIVHFDLGKKDNQFLMGAVVDGYFTLFTVNSRADVPESILRIGGNEKHELVRDIVFSGQTLQDFPKITEEDSFTVAKQLYKNENGEYEELILLSVRPAEGSYFHRMPMSRGGFTVAFVIGARPVEERKKPGAVMRLVHEPIHLDYRFHETEADLERLIRTNDRGGPPEFLQSELLATSQVAQLGRTIEHPALRTWRKEASDAIDDFYKGETSRLPVVYEVGKRRQKVISTAETSTDGSAISVVESVDLNTGRSVVKVNLGRESTILPGELQRMDSWAEESYTEELAAEIESVRKSDFLEELELPEETEDAEKERKILSEAHRRLYHRLDSRPWRQATTPQEQKLANGNVIFFDSDNGVSRSNEVRFSMFMITGRLYLGFRPPKGDEAHLVDLGDFDINQYSSFSFEVRPARDPEGSAEDEFYLLYSLASYGLKGRAGNRTHGETGFYRIRKNLERKFVVTENIKLNRVKGYFPVSELRARLHESSRGLLYFDHITPPSENLDEYQSLYVDTLPHVWVSGTTKDQRRPSAPLGFLRPLRHTKISNTGITYFEYEADRNEGGSSFHTQSGVYYVPHQPGQDVSDPDNRPPGAVHIKGQLLTPGDRDREYLTMDGFESYEFGQFMMTSFVMDPNFQKGNSGSQLYISLLHGRGMLQTALAATNLPRGLDLSRIGEVKLFATRQRREDSKKKKKSSEEQISQEATHFYLLYTIKPPEPKFVDGEGEGEKLEVVDEKAQKLTGTYLSVFLPQRSPARDRNQVDVLNLNQVLEEPVRLSQRVESLEKVEEADRVIVDAKGALHWVVDLEVDPLDEGYRLISLGNGKSFLPNKLANRHEFAPTRKDKNTKAYDPDSDWLIKKRRVHYGSGGMYSEDTMKYPAVVQSLIDSGYNMEFQTDIFPQITKLLEDVADPRKPAKLRIVVVPEEQRDFIYNFVLSRLTLDIAKRQRWNLKNRNLRVYMRHDTRTSEGQSKVRADLHKIAGERDRRPVFFGRITDYDYRPDIGRDGEERGDFTLKTVTKKGGERHEYENMPHFLYLLANEGATRPLDKFEEHFESLNRERRISGLFVATEKEVATVEESFRGVEGEFRMMDHFERFNLPKADPEILRNLARSAFEHDQVRQIGYSIDAESFNLDVTKIESEINAAEVEAGRPELEGEALSFRVQAELERRVAGFITSRISRISMTSKTDEFTNLNAFVSALQNKLMTDSDLKHYSNRRIDRRLIEQMIPQVFPKQAIALQWLSDDDPLKIASRDDFPILMTKAGYVSAMHVKQELQEGYLAQLKPSPAIAMPSSMMLYGESRTGKTFAFEKFIEALGLKDREYDLTAEYSENEKRRAQWIRIDASKVKSKSYQVNEMAGDIDIKKVKEHLYNLLSLPDGPRAFILIDDLHATSDPETRRELISLIRTLQDARDGAIPIQYNGGKKKRINVGRLTLVITMNPIRDPERLRRFGKGSDEPWAVAMATLSDDKYPVEESFFNRIARFVDLSKFSAGAKAPTLINNMQKSVRDNFTNHNKFLLYSPELYEKLAGAFKDENAKAFLLPAAQELGGLGDHLDHTGAYIVVYESEQQQVNPFGGNAWDEGIRKSTGAGNEGKLVQFIRDHARVIPLSDTYSVRLRFMRMLLDTFRVRAFEALSEGLTSHETLAVGMWRDNALGPMLHALERYGTERARIPMNQLKVRYEDFGVTTHDDEVDFDRIIESDSKGSEGFVAFEYDELYRGASAYERLFSEKTVASRQRDRRDVLRETRRQVSGILEEYLAGKLHVEDLDMLPDPKDWVTSGAAKDDARLESVLGERLSQAFLDFYIQFSDQKLTKGAAARVNTTFFDYAMFFYTMVDQAIIRLPWPRASRFMGDAVHFAAQSIEVNQEMSIQDFLFENEKGLMRPTTGDLLIHMLRVVPAYKAFDTDTAEQSLARFYKNCESLLDPVGRGAF